MYSTEYSTISLKEQIIISVIVPIYNVEEYLDKCIESIVNQSYKKLDIILVNDGSTDNSLRICLSYKSRDRRITLIDKSNGGLVSARKAGVKEAKGDYLIFVDGDDWIDHRYVERLATEINRNQVDVIACSYKRNIDDNRESYVKMNVNEQLYINDSFEKVLGRVFYCGSFFKFGINPSVSTKLLRTSLVRKAQEGVPDNITLGEDMAIFVQYMNMCQSVLVLSPEDTYHYMLRASSMTNAYNKKLWTGTRTLLNYLKQLDVKDSIIAQLEYYYAYLIIGLFDNEAKNREGGSFVVEPDIIYHIQSVPQIVKDDMSLYHKAVFHCITNGRYKCAIKICKLKQTIYRLINREA